jgi:hypothetical protein
MGIPVSGANAAPGTPAAGDLANMVLAGSFTGTASSPWFGCQGSFNVLIYGNSGPNGNWTGTVSLERTFDGGVTWIVCGVGGGGVQAVYSSAGTGTDYSVVVSEPEAGVAYRLRCTAFTGPAAINYRFSTTSPAATAWGIPPG